MDNHVPASHVPFSAELHSIRGVNRDSHLVVSPTEDPLEVEVKDEPVDGQPCANLPTSPSQHTSGTDLHRSPSSLPTMTSTSSSKNLTPKYKRGANWTKQMEVYLLQLIEGRKQLIESKRFNTDVTHARVTKTWVEITRLLAASVPDRAMDRSAIQKKWWALKKRGRAEIQEFKRESAKTDGSPAPQPLSDIGILVGKILDVNNTSVSEIRQPELQDSTFIALQMPVVQESPEEEPVAENSPNISVSPQAQSPVPRASSPRILTVTASAGCNARQEEYEEECRRLDLAFLRARLVREQRQAEMLEAKTAALIAERAAHEAARSAHKAARAAHEAARAATNAELALKSCMLHKKKM